MIQRLLLQILFIACIAPFAYGQNWLHSAGGNANDEALDLAVDAAGNTYTTGYFSQSVLFDSQFLSSSGNGDVFISKQDVNGNYLWAVKAGGAMSDRGYGIAVDGSGNVYVTGFFSGQATFGSTVLNAYNNSQDVFVSKIDMNGNFLWTLQLGGNDIDLAHAITCDNNGDVFITGQFKGTSAFGSNTFTSMTDPFTGQPSFDLFICAVSSAGNVMWARQGQAKYDDRGLDIACDQSNNLYVCGQFSDTLTTSTTYYNNAYNAGFLLKIDNNGNEQWLKRILATQVIAYGVKCFNNDVFVTGEFQGQLAITGSPNTYVPTPYLYNIFLAKINTSGVVQWAQSDGSENFVTSTELAIDASGNIYLAGMFKCSFSEYSQPLGSGVFYSAGYRDIFTCKYSNAGQRLWERQVGGPGDDYCSATGIHVADQPIVAGSYEYYFNVPVNGTMQMHPGIANSSANGPGNLSYCSDPSYGQFVSSATAGNKDIFSTNPVNTARLPYDYFVRGGPVCNRDTLQPYINYNQDSLSGCDSVVLYANLRTGKDGTIGPRYNYLWSNGSTNDSIIVYTSGSYWLKMWHEDECRWFYDTVYVNVTASPSVPSFVCPTHIMYTAIPASGCLQKLAIMPNDSALLIGVGFNPSYPHYWSTPWGTVVNDSVYATMSGVYVFTVEAPGGGCPSKVCLMVYQYGSGNCTINTMIPELHLTDLVFDAIDTVTVCVNEHFGMDLVDSTLFANGTPTILYTFVHWTITGGYTFDPYVSYPYTFGTHHQEFKALSTGNCTAVADILHPVSGAVVGTAVRNFFLKVISLPASNLQLSGPATFCPGDTATLIATGGDNYTWNGPGIIGYNADSSNAWVVMNGSFTVYSHVTDPVYGCTNSQFQTFVLNTLPAPPVTMLPANGLVCPNDSVMLTAENGTNYIWYGPNGNVISTTQTVYATTPGFYHYTFINALGCALVSDFVEVKEYTTPYLDAIPGTVICTNGSVQIEVQSNDNSLIQWQAPFSGNANTQVVTSPGTYTCSVTSCGITTVASIQIVASNTPAAIHVIGDTILCAGDTTILVGNGGMVNYEWLPSGITSPIITVTQPGTYILETTDLNGCFGHDTLVIGQHNAVPPPVANDTTICAGNMVTLTASGNNITWLNNFYQAIDTGNIHTTGLIGSNTTYYVQAADSVCSSATVAVHVFINPASVSPVITGDTLLCTGDSLLLTAQAIPGGSYQWNGPNGYTSTLQQILIPLASVADTGYYVLQVSDGICTSPLDSVHVSFGILPPSQLLTSALIACSGDTVVLSTDTSAQQVWWNTGDTTQSISVTVSGIYFATITGTSGCISYTDSVSLNILSPPASPMVNDTFVCAGTSVQFTVTGANIDWYSDSLIFLQTGNSFITPAINDTTLYYVTATDTNGCVSLPAPVTAYVVNPLTAVSINGDSLLCAGQTAVLVANAVPGFLYTWTDLNGQQVTGDSLVLNPGTADSGYVYLQVLAGGCAPVFDSIWISVHALPTGYWVDGDTTLCEGSDGILWAVDSSGYVYTWIYNNETTAGDSLAVYGDLNTPNVIGVVVSNGYCADTTTLTMNIIANPVIHIYIPPVACEGDTVQVSASVGTGSFAWTGPSGFSSAQSQFSLSPVDTTMEGYYVLTYTSNGICYRTDSAHLDVAALPELDLGNDTSICQRDILIVTAPPGYYYYNWSNGTTGITTTVNQSGYLVLTAWNPGGCMATDSIHVYLVDCTSPLGNVFSPNGDGVNDEWTVYSEGMKGFHCTIFNRWGNVVYEWSDTPGSWNGNDMQGQPVSIGVYYYVVDFENYFGNREEYKGTIQLFR